MISFSLCRSEIAEDLSIHLIVDNYSTHKHQKVRRWLERRPRFHLHFTPASASWMNMVERFFRDLSQQAILPGSFGSVAELVDTINRYLSQHNLEPKRYVWHADGQEVLNKIRRAWASRHKSCHFGFIVCFRVNFSEVR